MTLYIGAGEHMHGHAHHGCRSTVELTRSSNWALATTAALSMHADEPMLPFTMAGTLGSPGRHLDPTTALVEAWRCFCLL